MRGAYVFVFLLQISGIVAKGIAISFLWRLRKKIPLAKYVGILLSALTIEQIARLFTSANMPHSCLELIAPWMIYLGWLTGVARVLAVWCLVLYLLGILRNGHGKKSQQKDVASLSAESSSSEESVMKPQPEQR